MHNQACETNRHSPIKQNQFSKHWKHVAISEFDLEPTHHSDLRVLLANSDYQINFKLCLLAFMDNPKIEADGYDMPNLCFFGTVGCS